MVALRGAAKRRIQDALARSHFTEANFGVKFDDKARAFLEVTFLPNKKYRFVATEPAAGTTTYFTFEAPGLHVLDGERYPRADVKTCLDAVTQWADRILEDYRTQNPIIDEFDTLREALLKQVSEHAGDQDLHFSQSEAKALEEKLDGLAKRYEELVERTENAENTLRMVQTELNSLKGDLPTLPKGVWYRMASSKLVSLAKKIATSKEGRELALEAAKKFLLEGPK